MRGCGVGGGRVCVGVSLCFECLCNPCGGQAEGRNAVCFSKQSFFAINLRRDHGICGWCFEPQGHWQGEEESGKSSEH